MRNGLRTSGSGLGTGESPSLVAQPARTDGRSPTVCEDVMSEMSEMSECVMSEMSECVMSEMSEGVMSEMSDE